ncbi:MAG TPA: hypothetical protein PLE19_15775 [Planctomycetota bacterium]|nr:hypothetical protein [Planctomycetota bacterium]HRR81336.1 hypothetical protein [Planctomycetota bacterium]HRT95582.1 hypothetical protein [Planctomycetota bacterium]
MSKRWWGFAFVALAALATAGEAEPPTPKPKPKAKEEPSLPAPTDDELDKPGGKPIVPRPTPLPEPDDKAAPEPDQGGAQKTRPEHVNPFRERVAFPKYARPARITYSDQRVLEGHVWARADKPLRIYNRAQRAHQDYFLADLQRIEVKPEIEEFERDWRWKNQGSSEKVYLDTGYLWTQFLTTITLRDGTSVVGDCVGQFTIQLLDGQRESWVLYKKLNNRQAAGVPNKKRDEQPPLVYIKTVEFTDDFLKKPEEKANP